MVLAPGFTEPEIGTRAPHEWVRESSAPPGRKQPFDIQTDVNCSVDRSLPRRAGIDDGRPCSVDLRSTAAVGDRRYSRRREHFCRSL